MKTWDSLKEKGNPLYKNGGIEPIDLYRSMGVLRAFALCSIVKYAARNIGGGPDEAPVNNKDLDKIIHYTELLRSSCGTEEV